MNAGAVIQIAATMAEDDNPQVLWKRVLGQVALDMKDRGWSGGRFLDATWHDGLLSVTVGPGHGRIDVDALAEFIREQRRTGK